MAIDTQERRNAALIESCGIIFPDGAISEFDRDELLGWYPVNATLGDGRIEFTIPYNPSEFTIAGSQLDFTMPNHPSEFTATKP
jgi:hypothetical protein